MAELRALIKMNLIGEGQASVGEAFNLRLWCQSCIELQHCLPRYLGITSSRRMLIKVEIGGPLVLATTTALYPTKL